MYVCLCVFVLVCVWLLFYFFPLPSLLPFIPFVAIVGSMVSGLVFEVYWGRPRLWFHWSLGPQELVWNLEPGSVCPGLGPVAVGASQESGSMSADLVLRQTWSLGLREWVWSLGIWVLKWSLRTGLVLGCIGVLSWELGTTGTTLLSEPQVPVWRLGLWVWHGTAADWEPRHGSWPRNWVHCCWPGAGAGGPPGTGANPDTEFRCLGLWGQAWHWFTGLCLVLGSALKLAAHISPLPLMGNCRSPCWASQTCGSSDVIGVMWNSPFYPLRCIFPYFCDLPWCFNLSSGIISSYKGIFVCGYLFKLMYVL